MSSAKRKKEKSPSPSTARGKKKPKKTKANPSAASMALAAKKATEAGVQQFRKDHWGQKGTHVIRSLYAADPRILSIELGDLVAVIYRTKKGKDVMLTDYDHRFSKPYPVLSYNPTGLVISGGKYRVTERGIID